MSAPIGLRDPLAVTPLTTLVDALSSTLSRQDAIIRVAQLTLPPGSDPNLVTQDPFSLLTGSGRSLSSVVARQAIDPISALLGAFIQVQVVLESTSNLLAGATGLPPSQLFAVALNAIIQEILDTPPGQAFDLTNPNTLVQIIANAETIANIDLPDDVVQAAATILAEVNSLVDEQVASGDSLTGIVEDLLAIQSVVNEGVAEDLQNLGSGDLDPVEFVEQNTGDALQEQVDAVEIDLPVPDPEPTATPAPTIVVNAPTTAVSGETVTIGATATTPGGLASVIVSATGPGLNITVSYTPSDIGCTLGDLTCSISQSLTIPSGSSGTYSYSVQVTDQLGQVGTQTGSIVVN